VIRQSASRGGANPLLRDGFWKASEKVLQCARDQ
jgi:hypothetical protein